MATKSKLMGDILKHITEILSEGNNYEERRPYYPPTVHFFEGMDEPETAGGDKESGTEVKNITDRIEKEGV